MALYDIEPGGHFTCEKKERKTTVEIEGEIVGRRQQYWRTTASVFTIRRLQNFITVRAYLNRGSASI